MLSCVLNMQALAPALAKVNPAPNATPAPTLDPLRIPALSPAVTQPWSCVHEPEQIDGIKAFLL
jgi:hypothetical protein